ncbi:MAG: peptidylprolyl isomerase [Gammaproteobacteria bacterium]|nr:peptidylprolyl isomerase [Gammaproteobacteria bacterium]
MKTARDMVVSLHYTLKDDSGEVLDSSSGNEPLAYLHGHGNIIPGLEKALEGTTVGHKSKVSVAAADGYGEKNDELIFEAPREHFPTDMKLEEGARVYAEGPQGPVSFAVVKLTDTGAVLDGNHPLAGKTLHFDVEVVEVRPATKEELAHGHVHGAGGHHHDEHGHEHE